MIMLANYFHLSPELNLLFKVTERAVCAGIHLSCILVPASNIFFIRYDLESRIVGGQYSHDQIKTIILVTFVGQ